jgi:extradiol dioxygenase family protein
MRVGCSEIHLEVRDLLEARDFYQDKVGCQAESGCPDGIRFSLAGYLINCKYSEQLGKNGQVEATYHLVHSKYLPMAHQLDFGPTQWRELAKRLLRHEVRHTLSHSQDPKAAASERSILNFFDPSGNALEVQTSSNALRPRGLFGLTLRWLPWAILAILVMCGLWRGYTWEDDLSSAGQSVDSKNMRW